MWSMIRSHVTIGIEPFCIDSPVDASRARAVEHASSPPHLLFSAAWFCATMSPLFFSLATRNSSLRKLTW